MGRGTNLHSLWDSGLLKQEGLTDDELIAELKKQIHPSDQTDFQKGDLMNWLYGSYATSSTLYSEVAKNNVLDQSYYAAHIALVHNSLIAGGLRMAVVLNNIFKDNKPFGVAIPAQPISKVSILDVIDVKDVAKHMGENISVQAVGFSSKNMGNMILVNLGAAYPDQLMTVVLRGDAKVLAKDIDHKMIMVTGTVTDYKGKPEIIVENPLNFRIVPTVGDNSSKGRKGG